MCLKSNPKCYGTWFHRVWIIENFPEHNLQSELTLCNEYLNFDERNCKQFAKHFTFHHVTLFLGFIAVHCWDYRNYIVKKANVNEQEELTFTYDKIANNFSNYSSWRYRSQLLTRLYPNTGNISIRPDIHNEGEYFASTIYEFNNKINYSFRT